MTAKIWSGTHGATHRKESWRDVVGYEGLYRVSDKGRIFSNARTTTKGGMLSLATNGAGTKEGYVQVSLCKDGKKVNKLVHRLVLEAFAGECPEGYWTRHKTDEPQWNWWPESIEWAPRDMNLAERKMPSGERWHAIHDGTPRDSLGHMMPKGSVVVKGPLAA